MPAPVSRVSNNISACMPFWEYHLTSHPDSDFVEIVLNYLKDGIPIGYKGPNITILSDNWPSSIKYADKVTDFIKDNVTQDSVAGLLPHPLPPGYRASPLGAFEKGDNGKVRVIHDLSWPPGRSVNDFIPSQECALNYVTVDNAANLCAQYEEPWLVKIDLKSAFLSCPVQVKDHHLLGFSWKDADGNVQYYQFKVLCFGLKMSPKAFDRCATALHYMMVQRGASPTLLHYLDDYCCIAGSKEEAQKSLNVMIETAILAGFQVQESKTEGPARAIEFLGIMLDTPNKQLSISETRMREIYQLIGTWVHRNTCTKRQILSLIGKLSFSARVVRDGRKFVRRLIETSKKARNLHHTLKLTSQCKADLRWWDKCLATHNGTTWMQHEWDNKDVMVMYTDASDLAVAAVFERSWTVLNFTGDNSWMKRETIAWRELYAIVLGIALFGSRMMNRQLIMYTDNQAIMHSINTGTCKDPSIMALIRALYFYTSQYQIKYKSCYVHTLSNTAADSLSRLQYNKFKAVHPEAEPLLTPPCKVIIDFDY